MSALVICLHYFWPASHSRGVKIGFGEDPPFTARPSKVQMSPLGISIISEDGSFQLIRRWKRERVVNSSGEQHDHVYRFLKSETNQRDSFYVDEAGDRWKRTEISTAWGWYPFLHWASNDGSKACEFTLYADDDDRNKYAMRRRRIKERCESAVFWAGVGFFAFCLARALWKKFIS